MPEHDSPKPRLVVMPTALSGRPSRKAVMLSSAIYSPRRNPEFWKKFDPVRDAMTHARKVEQ